MATCPNCQNQIEITDKHMGALFTCPHCLAVFFVGWDGQPEMAQHESEAPPAYEPVVESPVNAVVDSVVEMPPVDDNFIVSPLEVPLETPVETMPPETTPVFEPEPADAPVETTPYNFDQPLSPHEGGGGFPTPEPEAPGSFQSVSDFANSEAANGPLTYTILIKGLELAETFKDFKDALTDSRFGWDAEALMANVKAGELLLRGVNPTKASILVNRIKYLPIEVSWKQEVYGEASP